MPTVQRIVTNPDGTVHVWTPYLYSDGTYKLAKPDAQLDRNLDENAVPVRTLDEVVELIGQRYSLRMSDGQSAPSLIGPESIIIS